MNLPNAESYVSGRWGRMGPKVVSAAVLALGGLLGQLPAGTAADDGPAVKAPAKFGRLFKITLPITADTVERIEQFADRVVAKAREADEDQPVLIFEFEIPPQQEEHARSTDFEDASKLARLLSQKLAAARTVAYVPESLPGHAVLVALACEDILMPAEAELGPVGAETIENDWRIRYVDVAGKRNTVPQEVALWLLDPTTEVLVVEVAGIRRFVSPQELSKLEEEGQPIGPQRRKLYDRTDLDGSIAQQPGVLTGQVARELNLVSYLAAGPQDVAKALELPREAMKEDFSLVGKWKAVRIDLDGPISHTAVRQAQNLIEEQQRAGLVNLVILGISSEGGSLTESISMANYLADLDPTDGIRTVAYVNEYAKSDAALIALACDQLIMHPQAELGGAGEYRLSREQIELAREPIQTAGGPWSDRSWSLVAAMIDPDLQVFRCTRPGDVGYFCDEELEEVRKKPQGNRWQKGNEVTKPGVPLSVTGDLAVDYHLADRTFDSFAGLKEHYGLEGDLAPLEPGWADFLVEALASPGLSALLLTIAFVSMYAELHAPGMGVGAFVATVCFLLFFWSHYLGGTATGLEIILFLAGIACLALEVFVLPGFGIFGLGGGCLVLVSLILASQTVVIPRNPSEFAELRRSLVTIASAGIGVVAVGMLLRRYLPRAPILSRMMLAPPEGKEAANISRRESLVDLQDFVGARGLTTTQLTPSGKARFDDMLVDVLTDGDVLPAGTEIEVVEVHGNRVIVKAAESG